MSRTVFTFEPYRVDEPRQLIDIRIYADGTYCGHLTLPHDQWLAFTSSLAYGHATAALDFTHIESTLSAIRADRHIPRGEL